MSQNTSEMFGGRHRLRESFTDCHLIFAGAESVVSRAFLVVSATIREVTVDEVVRTTERGNLLIQAHIWVLDGIEIKNETAVS